MDKVERSAVGGQRLAGLGIPSIKPRILSSHAPHSVFARCAALSLALALTSATVAADPALAAKLDSILQGHGVKGVHFAGKVVALPSGTVLYEHDAERPMTPASNAKLVVMSAAIERLGVDYHFETVLGMRGADLVVVGGGDPAFGDPRLAKARGRTITQPFHDWAAELKKAGISHVSGRLIFDDTIFDAQHVHPEWPADQHLGWYEAPIGGLNFNDNCVTVSARPSSAGQPAALSMIPGNTALTLLNRTHSGGGQTAAANRARGGSEIVVSGKVSRRGPVTELTVPDPGLFFAASLRSVLAAEGIRIDGPIVRARIRIADGHLPPDLRVIARHRTSIGDVLARAGKNSLGMMAEGLCKMLGAHGGAPGSWRSGGAAVEAFVRSCGVSPGQCRFDDGSGLSREDKLSPAAAVAVLRHMFQSRGRDLLMASLSHAGTDGTLEKRMRDTKDQVIAKTGYIGGVRTLAGYIHTHDGQWLAFAFYYNHCSSTGPLTHAQDQACRLLVKGAAAFEADKRHAAKLPRKSAVGNAR